MKYYIIPKDAGVLAKRLSVHVYQSFFYIIIFSVGEVVHDGHVGDYLLLKVYFGFKNITVPEPFNPNAELVRSFLFVSKRLMLSN